MLVFRSMRRVVAAALLATGMLASTASPSSAVVIVGDGGGGSATWSGQAVSYYPSYLGAKATYTSTLTSGYRFRSLTRMQAKSPGGVTYSCYPMSYNQWGTACSGFGDYSYVSWWAGGKVSYTKSTDYMNCTKWRGWTFRGHFAVIMYDRYGRIISNSSTYTSWKTCP